MRDAFFASPRLPRLAEPEHDQGHHRHRRAGRVPGVLGQGGRRTVRSVLLPCAAQPLSRRAVRRDVHHQGRHRRSVSRATAGRSSAGVRSQGAGAESGELVVREGTAADTPDMRGSGTSRFQTAVPVHPSLTIETDRRKRRRSAARLGRRGPRAEVDELLHQGALALAVGGGLRLTVKLDATPSGGVSEQKVEETKVALRELGLTDQVNTE